MVVNDVDGEAVRRGGGSLASAAANWASSFDHRTAVRRNAALRLEMDKRRAEREVAEQSRLQQLEMALAARENRLREKASERDARRREEMAQRMAQIEERKAERERQLAGNAEDRKRLMEWRIKQRAAERRARDSDGHSKTSTSRFEERVRSWEMVQVRRASRQRGWAR